MNNNQFRDRYAEINAGYVKYKQEHYKRYYSDNRVYTEDLFWEKLVHLGWRKSLEVVKDQSPLECLVLVCPECELAIAKAIIKNIGIGNLTITKLLNAKEDITKHQQVQCKALSKSEKP